MSEGPIASCTMQKLKVCSVSDFMRKRHLSSLLFDPC